METRIYETRISEDVSSYILGRIVAAQDIICQDDPASKNGYKMAQIVERDNQGYVLRICSTTFAVETDQERYDKFSLLVAEWYPDIDFEFDIDGIK